MLQPFIFALWSIFSGRLEEIIVTGRLDDHQTLKLLEVLRSAYMPQATIIFYQEGDEGERIAALAPTCYR